MFTDVSICISQYTFRVFSPAKANTVLPWFYTVTNIFTVLGFDGQAWLTFSFNAELSFFEK